MEVEKFKNEVLTLKKFYEYYCFNRHKEEKKLRNIELKYKDKYMEFDFTLCDECMDIMNYNIQRLEACPHEIKPRCRKCKEPCYEKEYWKKTSKMMAYSAINFGLSKAKKRIKSFF